MNFHFSEHRLLALEEGFTAPQDGADDRLGRRTSGRSRRRSPEGGRERRGRREPVSPEGGGERNPESVSERRTRGVRRARNTRARRGFSEWVGEQGEEGVRQRVRGRVRGPSRRQRREPAPVPPTELPPVTDTVVHPAPPPADTTFSGPSLAESLDKRLQADIQVFLKNNRVAGFTLGTPAPAHAWVREALPRISTVLNPRTSPFVNVERAIFENFTLMISRGASGFSGNTISLDPTWDETQIENAFYAALGNPDVVRRYGLEPFQKAAPGFTLTYDERRVAARMPQFLSWLAGFLNRLSPEDQALLRPLPFRIGGSNDGFMNGEIRLNPYRLNVEDTLRASIERVRRRNAMIPHMEVFQKATGIHSIAYNDDAISTLPAFLVTLQGIIGPMDPRDKALLGRLELSISHEENRLHFQHLSLDFRSTPEGLQKFLHQTVEQLRKRDEVAPAVKAFTDATRVALVHSDAVSNRVAAILPRLQTFILALDPDDLRLLRTLMLNICDDSSILAAPNLYIDITLGVDHPMHAIQGAIKQLRAAPNWIRPPIIPDPPPGAPPVQPPPGLSDADRKVLEEWRKKAIAVGQGYIGDAAGALNTGIGAAGDAIRDGVREVGESIQGEPLSLSARISAFSGRHGVNFTHADDVIPQVPALLQRLDAVMGTLSQDDKRVLGRNVRFYASTGTVYSPGILGSDLCVTSDQTPKQLTDTVRVALEQLRKREALEPAIKEFRDTHRIEFRYAADIVSDAPALLQRLDAVMRTLSEDEKTLFRRHLFLYGCSATAFTPGIHAGDLCVSPEQTPKQLTDTVRVALEQLRKRETLEPARDAFTGAHGVHFTHHDEVIPQVPALLQRLDAVMRTLSQDDKRVLGRNVRFYASAAARYSPGIVGSDLCINPDQNPKQLTDTIRVALEQLRKREALQPAIKEFQDAHQIRFSYEETIIPQVPALLQRLDEVMRTLSNDDKTLLRTHLSFWAGAPNLTEPRISGSWLSIHTDQSPKQLTDTVRVALEQLRKRD